MKSFIPLSALALCCAALPVQAQSLYDLAEPLSVSDESGGIPLKWTFNLSGGYDTNVNSSNHSAGQHEAAFISAGIGASLANYDAITQYAFAARLGGIFYLKDMAGDANESLSDSTLTARITHRIDPTLRYTGSVSFAWQPEPNYATGISSARRDGDYIYVYVDSSISKAWTTRYSTTVGANFSLIDYQDATVGYDNRRYVGVNMNNRYRWTDRMALSLYWAGSYCTREYGNDEFSNFVMGGWEYAVSQHTTATLRVGPQFKHVQGYSTKAYPSVEFALNHRLSDRFTLGTFVRYSNEAVNTYYGSGSFASNETWRWGIHATAYLTHRVSVNWGFNLVNSDYSRPQGGYTTDTNTLTLQTAVGARLLLTNTLALVASYSYTNGSYGGYNYPMPDYNRNVFSFGISYNF